MSQKSKVHSLREGDAGFKCIHCIKDFYNIGDIKYFGSDLFGIYFPLAELFM